MNDDSDPMKKSEMSSLKKIEKSPLLLSIFMHGDLVDMVLMTIGFLGSVSNGLAMPLSMLLVSKSMNILGAGPSSDSDHFRRSINQNTLIFFYLAGVSFMATFLEGYCWTRTGARQASRMRIRYLKAVLRQEISYFDLQDHNKFEVVTGVSNEILVIQDVLSEKIPNLVATLTRFVGGYMVALILMWRLALVAFPFVVLTIVPIMVSGRILMGLARKVRKEYNKAGAIADQAISSIRTVYSFVGEKKTINEFAAALNESMKLGQKQGLAKGVAVGTPSVTYAVWSFMIWYGSKMVMYHGAQGGTIQAVGFLIATGGLSLASTLSNLKSFTEAFSAGERIMEVINRVSTIDSESMGGETLQNVSGEVKFKNVKFAYPSRPTNIIFHNLNLEISAGKKLALVGASGSGKSTVIALLERFYDPLDGQILLDGISINKLQLKWFRSQMGLVSQEPALFATSIKENILFGKEDGNMEEVIAAAKASNVHSFISQLPQGYDTLVGEGGTQISGGQKQRIAIARAVIKLPRVLLLDEATSALDSESEKIVQDALDKVAIDRTTIIIAHHLSTICYADTIVVIQDGKVMENGSHKELMRIDNGLYSSLIQLQQASKFTKDQEDEQNETSSSSHITYRDERNNSTDLPLERQSSSFSDADSVEQAEAKFDIKHVSQNNTSSYQRLLLLSLTEWKQASLGFVSALLSGSVQPIYAFVMGSMVSAFFLNDHSRIKSKTRIYSLILICLSVFSSLTTVNLHYNFTSMGEQFTKKIRERMLTKVLTFEVGWFDQEQNTSGAICSRLSNDANVVRSLMGDQMPLLAQTLSTVLIAYALGLIIAWRLSIVMLAIQPLTILCYYLRKALLKRLAQKATNSQAESSKLTAEVVSNIRTITAFSSQTRILTLLNRAQAGPQRENIRQSWIAGTILGAAVAVNSINSAIVFWYGRKLISQGYITPTALFKTFLILVHTGQGIADAGSTTTEIAKGAAAAQSIFGLLDRVTEIEPEKQKGHQPNYLVGQVELHDIDFAYPARPDVMIFKGLSLKIEAKKSTALVGCSGSGKSTVINLIERFYDPLRGRVEIDGKDVRTYNLRAMRKQVALVSQEPNLFEGTIKENIAYGASESVDESEVIGAALIANAHDFIVGLRDGYNTRCGDKGVQLSGGQKQRLAIARAILKNPAILLLDEATSALDSRSEKVVQEALDQVMAGRTSVVVAHRLTTIRNCDEIVVLDKGIVVEKGTHLSLMEKGLTGSFCSLVTLQQKPTNKKFLE